MVTTDPWGPERWAALAGVGADQPRTPRKTATTVDERGRLVVWSLYDDGTCYGFVGEPGPELAVPRLRLVPPLADD